MSKVRLTFDRVSATALGDVIRTGRVISVARIEHLTYRVEVESLGTREIPALVRALARPHNTELVISVDDLNPAF